MQITIAFIAFYRILAGFPARPPEVDKKSEISFRFSRNFDQFGHNSDNDGTKTNNNIWWIF